MSSTAQASIKNQISPLFQWLLNRPPIVRGKRTWIIISADPDLVAPSLTHELCKVKFSFGLHEMKRFEMNCRLPTRMIPAQGRHRPSFKRYDYPKDTPWYAFTSPLPPGIQKSDLRHLWHDVIDKFCKNNWRSEEQTEKAVEELGKTFDGGLLIESPGGAIPFEDMEAALPKSSGERYYDIKLGDGPKPPHASDHSWLGGYGINTTGRAGKTMEDLTLSQLAKNDGEDSKDPTGWYRIYENPNRRPGDPTLQETMQMFMKLWESADLSDEVHCMKVSEEIKELFQHHEIIRLSKSAFHAKLKEDEE